MSSEPEPEPGLELELEDRRNPHAVALGRLGGKKTRGWMRRLEPEERSRRMRELVCRRWEKAGAGAEPEAEAADHDPQP